jgi:hypothetical protein
LGEPVWPLEFPDPEELPEAPELETDELEGIATVCVRPTVGVGMKRMFRVMTRYGLGR